MIAPSSPHALTTTSLSLLLFSFSLEEALLLICTETLELAVALLLLGLVAEQLSVFCTFCLDNLAKLLGFIFASLAHAAHDLRTEVRTGHELIGHAKEVGEERDRVGVRVELHGQCEALLGDKIIKTVDLVSIDSSSLS
jgi:hypothetical protein